MADTRIRALRRFALSITVFNIVGHLLLGFEQAYLTPVVAVLTAYAMEIGLEAVEALVNGRRPRVFGFAGTEHPLRDLVDHLLPAHITGMACAMLLYGNARLMPTVLAVVVAIASKYLLRVRLNGRARHVLNPSNFGIVAVLLLFPWVSIAPPYHFTELTVGPLDWLIPVGILTAGTMLNGKLTGKLPLIMAWVGGFAAQGVLRWALLDDISLVNALLPMTGVAFVLYTNYMITDPSTTPVARRGQVAFGLATAAAYGVLVQFHIVFGLFFALTAVCALRGAVLYAAELRRRAAERAGSGVRAGREALAPATVPGAGR